MRKKSNRRKIFGLLLIFLGICLSIIISEMILHILLSRYSKYYVYYPNLRKTFNPLPGIMPGIEGKANFYVNSEGIRGKEFSDDQVYRILVMGGSTAECIYLDQDTENWAFLLEHKLNTLKKLKVWIGNIGRSGHNTRDHILQFRYIIPQLPKIDMVILLVGQNDFMCRLIKDESYDPEFTESIDFEEKQIPHAFSLYPQGEQSKEFYKNLAIWRFLRRLKYRIIRRFFRKSELINDAGKQILEWRRKRQAAKRFLDKLPDLTSGLKEYEYNLNKIIRLSREYSVRLLFLTQPFMWHKDMSEDELKLLQSGGKGDFRGKWLDEYYTPEALARGLDLYNKKLIEICKKEHIEYIDLATKLPKDISAFYDDVHYNENGSRIIAEIIYNYLKRKYPFVDFNKN